MSSFRYKGYNYNLTSLYEFINEYNIRNNEVASEKNLNAAVNKLKRELNQIIGQIKILTSQESINWSPLIQYEAGEIVSFFNTEKPEYTQEEIEDSFYLALPNETPNLSYKPTENPNFWTQIKLKDLYPKLYLDNYALKNQELTDWEANQDFSVVNIKKLNTSLENTKVELAKTISDEYVRFDNIKEYNVTDDFQPANKKYVDTLIAELNENIANFENLLGAYVKIEGSQNKMQTQNTGYVTALSTPNQGILPGSNGISNIGSINKTFNNVYSNIFHGIATKAKYADIAEIIETDLKFDKGSIISLDIDTQDFCLYQENMEIFGVISSKPGIILNSEAKGILVAHKGQVPVKVKGPVFKGGIIIANPGGYGICIKELTNENRHLKIGISLETNTNKKIKLVNVFI